MTTSASRRKSPARRPSLSSLRLDLSSVIGADTTRQILLLQFAFALGGLAPLTSDWDPPTLVRMRIAKPILLAVIVMALAMYAFDCLAMSTPDEAMQCCETMPSMHASFVRPASVHGLSFSPVFIAVLPRFNASQDLDSQSKVLTAHCHAPPIPQTAAPSPLRI